MELHPAYDFLTRLSENYRQLVGRVATSIRSVALICLDIDGKGVSYWMKSGSGTEKGEWTEKNDWTKTRLSKRAEDSEFFEQAVAILSTRT